MIARSRLARSLCSRSFFIASAAFGAAACWSTEALASGFTVAHFGGDHGNVTADNPTAIYYNPAGLADRDPADEEKKFEVHLFIDGNFAFRKLTWDHAASKSDVPEPMGAAGANTGEASLFNFVVAPMIGANFKIKDFAIGAGFYVPFGGQESWDSNPKFASSKLFPGPVDGVQRWHNISGILRSSYITLAAAYDIVDRVSFGASINLIRSDAQTIRARVPDGSNDISQEGRSLLDVGGWEGSFGVGILGEIVPRKLWIGASYQAQPGVVGEMDLKGTLQNNFGGTKTNDKVQLFQALPAIYRLGIRARPADKWEVRLTGEVQDYSVFTNQCIAVATAKTCTTNADGSATAGENPAPIQNIVRRWTAAFSTRLGASYWVADPVELFASFGYDSNAVPSSTLEPTLMDFHTLSPALGGTFSIGKHLKAEISYTQYIAIPRNTTGQSILATLASPSKTPDSGGKYNQILGVIDVNAEVSF